MEVYFATNPKMVLINDDECIIADIVLDVELKLKILNHTNTHNVHLHGTFGN